jgi:hypothetical protein
MKIPSFHRAALPAFALVFVVVLVAVQALAGAGVASAEPAPQAKKNRYIGAQKCGTCHDKDETGNQHAAWLKEKHASAFTALGSDKAKEVAKAKGIADPQKDPSCVKCHVTAHGVAEAEFMKGFDMTMGVQCESCHGPGEQHMTARMRAAREKVDGYPKIPATEIVALPSADVCTACHNTESPTFKPFCPHERMEEIKHWNPKKPRTEEQKKGYPCTCNDDCVCKKDHPEHKCRSVK